MFVLKNEAVVSQWRSQRGGNSANNTVNLILEVLSVEIH